MYLARSYSNINKIKTQRKAVILGLFFRILQLNIGRRNSKFKQSFGCWITIHFQFVIFRSHPPGPPFEKENNSQLCCTLNQIISFVVILDF